MFDYEIPSKMNVLAWVNFIVGLIISAAIIIICIKNGIDANKYSFGRDDSFIWTAIIGGGLSVFATVIVSFVIAAIGNIAGSLETIVYNQKNVKSTASSDEVICHEYKE